MRTELFNRVTSGRHGDGASSDGFAAGNIVGRVADDEYAVGGKFISVVSGCAAQCVWPEIVAVFGVVGKGSEGKRRP